VQRSPRPLPRPEDRLAASSLAAHPSGLSRQPRRSRRPEGRFVLREPRLQGPPEPLSVPSALDEPPKRLASTSWQRFGTQEVEGVSLGMRAAAWLRRAARRGASNFPTFSEPDSWHRANLCTRRYMVGGGAGPELGECRSHCNLSQRLKESPLEIAIDLRTPIRELQTLKSTNSRCRRTSHWSLSLFPTPQDSALSFSGNFSSLERLDPFSLPNTNQALNWLHSEPRSYGGFSPLRRLKTRAATNTRLTSPSCATPSGFLNLLTSYSARALLALFHARSVLGVEALRGFPLPVAATAFAAHCPFASYSALRWLKRRYCIRRSNVSFPTIRAPRQ